MLLSTVKEMKEYAVSQPIRKHRITPFAFFPTLPELQPGQAHSFCHILQFCAGVKKEGKIFFDLATFG